MVDPGLEKVVAAETVLSDVQGEAGRLIIRGHEVGELARDASFEDTAHLLWSGFFAEELSAAELKRRLGAARASVFGKMKELLPVLAHMPEVEALRAALSLIGDGHDLDAALELAAAMAVASGNIARLKAGGELVPPDPKLGQAEDLLRMIRGSAPSKAEAKALEAYLVTTSDHGLNASTFVARCVASTKAGLGSAVVAALSSLKGPLHGGAPGPVLDMLDGIGTAENAETWIRSALDRGERLMGFGHRVYRTRDPRADVLKRVVASLPQSAGRLALASAIEGRILARLKAEKPDRSLDTNVEYYTSILLEAVGAPRGLFTCLFACGRVMGWLAHAQEQLATKRLVRPASVYVGPRVMAAA